MIHDVALQGKAGWFGPINELRDSQQMRLMRLYPGTLIKDAQHVVLVPAPMTARVGGKPLRDVAMLRWASDLDPGRCCWTTSRPPRGSPRADESEGLTSRTSRTGADGTNGLGAHPARHSEDARHRGLGGERHDPAAARAGVGDLAGDREDLPGRPARAASRPTVPTR